MLGCANTAMRFAQSSMKAACSSQLDAIPLEHVVLRRYLWVITCLHTNCARCIQVHVAYQTSGCIAVHDHDALRHLDFVERFGSISGTSTAESSAKHAEVKAFIARKKPGEVCNSQL